MGHHRPGANHSEIPITGLRKLDVEHTSSPVGPAIIHSATERLHPIRPVDTYCQSMSPSESQQRLTDRVTQWYHNRWAPPSRLQADIFLVVDWYAGAYNSDTVPQPLLIAMPSLSPRRQLDAASERTHGADLRSRPRWETPVGMLRCLLVTCVLLSSIGAAEWVHTDLEPLQDELGQTWDINRYGAVQKGTNGAFHGAASLRIDRYNFKSSEQLVNPSTGVIRLTATIAELEVTRSIRIDTLFGFARYLEVIHNPGTEARTVDVTILTQIPVQNKARKLLNERGESVSSGKLPLGTSGFMPICDGKQVVPVMLVAGKNNALRPMLKSDNNYQFVTVYEQVTIEAGGTVSVLHFLAQRSGVTESTASEVFAGFYRAQLADTAIPRKLRHTVANWQPEELRPGKVTLGSLDAIQRLLDHLAIIRGDSDMLYLDEAAALSGKLVANEIRIQTSHGIITVPGSDVAGLIGGGGVGRVHRLYLRSGEVLTGVIALPDASFTSDEGWDVAVDIDTLNVLLTRRGDNDGRLPAATTAMIDLHSGERIALDDKSGFTLDVATAWGSMSLASDDVRELSYVTEPQPGYLLHLVDGSRLPVALHTRNVTLHSELLGTIEVPVHAIARYHRLGGTTQTLTIEGLGTAPERERVTARLARLTNLDVSNGRITDILTQLQQAAEIDIVLADELATEFDAIPISVTADQLSVKTIMQTLCIDYALHPRFRDGTIVLLDAQQRHVQPGLQASYFDNNELRGTPVHVRAMPPHFDNANGAGMTSDTWSVRLVGEIEITEAGEHNFLAVVDDGMRLTIAGTTIIGDEAWQQQSATEYSGSLHLTEGWHQIEIEYFNAGGDSVLALSQTTPSGASMEVTMDILRHEVGAEAAAAVTDGPHCRLGNDHVIMGSVADEKITINTLTGPVDIATASIESIAIDTDNDTNQARYIISFAGGNSITGPIEQRNLTLQTATGTLMIPTWQIVAYQQTPTSPPASTEEDAP